MSSPRHPEHSTRGTSSIHRAALLPKDTQDLTIYSQSDWKAKFVAAVSRPGILLSENMTHHFKPLLGLLPKKNNLNIARNCTMCSPPTYVQRVPGQLAKLSSVCEVLSVSLELSPNTIVSCIVKNRCMVYLLVAESVRRIIKESIILKA